MSDLTYLTEPIGDVNVWPEDVEIDPESTPLDVIAGVLAIAVQAQCEEMSDEGHVLVNWYVPDSNLYSRLYDDLAGMVMAAVNRTIEEWKETAVAHEEAAGAMRRIAAEWHGGQGSPLLAFSTSGAVAPKLHAEVTTLLLEANVDDTGEEAIDELTELADYVKRCGVRGPVPGWSDLWS